MKTSQLISLASFVLSAQALAAPQEPIQSAAPIIPLEKRDANVGICRVGVDSPCNGDAWDANGADGKTWENSHRFKVGQRDADPVVVASSSEEKREAEPAPVPVAAPLEEEKRDASVIGICSIGVDSPCNGDKWDANGADGKTWENSHRFKVGQRDAAPVVVASSSEEKREAEPAPVAAPLEEEKRDASVVGICSIGVNSPCNGDKWDANGADGKTWENYHRFRAGRVGQREAKPFTA